MLTLPPELIPLLIGDDPAVYYKLVLSWPTFARKALSEIERYKDNFTKLKEDATGNKKWKLCGRLHRCHDQPAVIYADGSRYWYVDGKLHRDSDQPAVVYADGAQYWYVDGRLHRDNGQPAVIYADGSRY